MSAKDMLVWLFARNTKPGHRYLYGDAPAEPGTAAALRARLEGRWFSKYTVNQGTIELLVDRDGNQTTAYPHVHVIHDEANREVRVLVSLAPGNHPHSEVLPGTASGNEVNAAIDRAIELLRRY